MIFKNVLKQIYFFFMVAFIWYNKNGYNIIKNIINNIITEMYYLKEKRNVIYYSNMNFQQSSVSHVPG